MLVAERQQFHIPGRHGLVSGGLFSWNWPGVYAEFQFSGSELHLEIEGNGCVVRLTVDGISEEHGPLPRGSFALQPEVAKGVAMHHVRLETIHQDFDLPFSLLQVSVKRGLFQSATNQLARPLYIEFIGDSWMSGFGNRSATMLDSDCTQAFPALLAQRWNADYALLAASGRGIVKNYGELPPSQGVIPQLYHTSSETELRRRADLAIVLAGENDFSELPWPEESLFIQAYASLLKQVRQIHAGVQILVLGVARTHPAAELARQVVLRDQEQGLTDIDFLPVPDLDVNIPMGYLWHPSMEHHRHLAEYIFSHSTAVTPRG